MSASFRRLGRAVIAAALVWAAAAGPAAAADPEKDFFGKDDRLAADTETYPFRAIGRLDFVSGGHCTAALVAPRIILTAAHCLFVERGARLVVDPPTVFRAGYSRGQAVATAAIVDWWLSPGYDEMRHTRDETVDGYDWAFLTLAEPIGDKTGTLEIYQALTPGDLDQAAAHHWDAIGSAGYSADSEEVQTVHMGCPILHSWPDNTFFHQCDMLEGNSGGPLFIQRDGRAMIVGIASTLVSDMKGYVRWGMAVDSRAFGSAFIKYQNRVAQFLD